MESQMESQMTFGKLFVKGALGAGFATLLFQIFQQMVLEDEVDMLATVLFALASGLVYGCYFAILHLRRVATELSCFACGFLTVATAFCGLLLWATLAEFEVDLSINTLFDFLGLSLACGLGGHVFSQVSVKFTYTRE